MLLGTIATRTGFCMPIKTGSSFTGLTTCLNRTTEEQKLLYIPAEKEVDQVVAVFGSKYASMLQLMKESAFGPTEVFRLTPKDFNLETQIVTLNDPAKKSKPRKVKMSNKLTAMIRPLIEKTDFNKRIWSERESSFKAEFITQPLPSFFCFWRTPLLIKVMLSLCRTVYLVQLSYR